MRNEPAFPRPISNDCAIPDGISQGDRIEYAQAQEGMMLRDYFAIRFASVMLGAPRQRNERRLNTATIIHRAYELADAMLEARAK